jgi:hypothetical protein
MTLVGKSVMGRTSLRGSTGRLSKHKWPSPKQSAGAGELFLELLCQMDEIASAKPNQVLLLYLFFGALPRNDVASDCCSVVNNVDFEADRWHALPSVIVEYLLLQFRAQYDTCW